MVLTGGNVNDTAMFKQVPGGVEFRRPDPGRPATRLVRVLADKGYSNAPTAHTCDDAGIRATVPERCDQQTNRARCGKAGGRVNDPSLLVPRHATLGR
ncbi:hypothetical protein GCM10010464_26810 [Pseudonocardia yunnanensis]